MHSLRAGYAGLPEYAGQYRLESVLGSGGMGVVRLATSGSGLKLAVKIVHPEHAVDPEFRARFRQEVAAARRVSGAFTAPVVDADPDAERPWMATLFIDAPTLAERVRERVLDPPELTRLAAGLAEALRDIHRAGVVHRDLKPSNVLMAPDGVRVIDFGISRPADSDLRTETGKLIGTPPYMAPEQFQRPRDVGTAADVFALGAVLVHAATGRGPFDSDSHYLVAYQVVHSEPDLTGLPQRLAPLVARCLAKEPAERPTAEALIAEMRAIAYPTSEDTQAFVPQPRRPAEAVEPAQATHRRERIEVEAGAGADPGAGPGAKVVGRRRWRRWAVVAALGLLLAGATIGGYAWLAGPSDQGRPAVRAAGPTPKSFAPWTVTLGNRVSTCSWDTAALYCSGPGVAAARLDPADGSLRWSARTSTDTAQTGAPLHAGGLVLTVTEGGRLLRALDPATGTERWKREMPRGAQAVPAGARVLVTAADGKATALDAASGAVQWTKQLGGVGSAWRAGSERSGGEPVLYVSTPAADGRSTLVTVVDPANGAARTQVRVAGTVEPFGLSNGSLYLLDNDARLMARSVVRVELASRAVRSVRLLAPMLQAQATVGPDGVAYVFGTSGALAAVSGEREQWRLETGVTAASAPAVGDGRVYLTALDGRLLAVDAATHRLVGQTKPRMGGDKLAPTLPAPVVADGKVYASAPDGSVFAVDGANPAGW
ncbi:PQQ-binding-like beta-propeller repeat protein [Streptomyces sp. NBC_01551]|uniref:serine/threonine-protein kinase n=1 Tax=Streptomyces sp. NBC_01551 TaxID=2975876 RepID=UPI0022580DAF|nr:serine/threonine-protein kinase [Streptomyces sp. NBC_01551]MCX4527346.1 PQQ-binding-like beta-propeller repeat protein [Streptomyces sp. NBC_01551]